jgi:hypothetical protein
MSEHPPRPTYILKIQLLRGDDIQQLRHLLKRLLRRHQCAASALSARQVIPSKTLRRGAHDRRCTA